MPFHITGPNDEKKRWYLSAIAIFDIHSGRFTGFRGSARSEMIEPHTAPAKDMPQEEALEEYTTTQALKAVSQNLPRQEALAVPQNAVATESIAQKAYNEEVAAELLQNISHEFRTPLNAIIGFSEMIDMEAWGPVNKQYHDNIKNILTAAVHLKEAVNDVLDSAKLDAGLMQISPESFSLKSVLRSCLENVDTMASEKEVQLTDNDNNIDVILYNDKQSVELCLTKMLTSIIRRATGHEMIGPSILINSNAQVRIELPVLGPRIREENAAEIFQKLETGLDMEKNISGNGQKTEPHISSGFGLSIAQDLAQLIGGDISVHSTQGYVSHLVLTLSNYDPAS
jgi:signal transduction histidine kinase